MRGILEWDANASQARGVFHFVLLTLEVELKVAQTSEDHAAMTIDKANDFTRDMWRGYHKGGGGRGFSLASKGPSFFDLRGAVSASWKMRV